MSKYLVIGASSGIGSGIAKRLVKEGHSVYGTYNKTDVVAPNDIQFYPLDVTTDFELDFLPEVLDGIVYCPGSINLKPFKRISPQSFLDDLNLQVVGAIKTIQKAMPAISKSNQASIVLFSSVAVQSGFTFHSQVSASKGAIEGLTRALAAEFAPSIRVNAIAPSLTDTPLASKLLSTDQKRDANVERHPMKRIGSADDMANSALFLLSEQSSWITGQVMHVDGGMSSIR